MDQAGNSLAATTEGLPTSASPSPDLSHSSVLEMTRERATTELEKARFEVEQFTKDTQSMRNCQGESGWPTIYPDVRLTWTQALKFTLSECQGRWGLSIKYHTTRSTKTATRMPRLDSTSCTIGSRHARGLESRRALRLPIRLALRTPPALICERSTLANRDPGRGLLDSILHLSKGLGPGCQAISSKKAMIPSHSLTAFQSCSH